MTLIFTDTKGRHYVVDTKKLEINNVKNAEIKSNEFILTITENDD